MGAGKGGVGGVGALESSQNNAPGGYGEELFEGGGGDRGVEAIADGTINRCIMNPSWRTRTIKLDATTAGRDVSRLRLHLLKRETHQIPADATWASRTCSASSIVQYSYIRYLYASFEHRVNKPTNRAGNHRSFRRRCLLNRFYDLLLAICGCRQPQRK